MALITKLAQKLKDAAIPFEYEYELLAYPSYNADFMYLIGQEPFSNDLVLFYNNKSVTKGDIDKIYNIIKEHWTNELECQ